MGPVLRGVQRKLLEPLDQEDAGVADVTSPRLGLAQLETPGEELLVFSARREPRAAGLGAADAATLCRPVHQALVQRGHGESEGQPALVTSLQMFFLFL